MDLTDKQAVDALQHAIWFYEDEVDYTVSNWFTQQVETYFDGLTSFTLSANYDAGPGGALFPKFDGVGNFQGRYVVYAVNTTYTDTDKLAQDTLFMGFIPSNTPTVTPEPMALFIWAFGLCLVLLGRRTAK